MASKLEIKRVCEFCGSEFVAKTTRTRYCSHLCNGRAYKQKKRNEKLKEMSVVTEKVADVIQQPEQLQQKEFLTISETASLLSVTRQTVYNWLNSGVLSGRRFSNRKVLIYRQHLLDLFESRQAYERPKPKEKKAITEFYTVADVERLYKVKYRRLNDIIKQHRIPKTLRGGILYISKSHVDNYFNKRDRDIKYIKAWYTVEEIIEKYGISRDAVYGRVRDHDLPKKSDGRYVKISKKHFDEIYKVEL